MLTHPPAIRFNTNARLTSYRPQDTPREPAPNRVEAKSIKHAGVSVNKSLMLAYNSFHSMVSTTVSTLPYILVGLIVFGLFYLASKGLRGLITRLTRANTPHHSVAMVLGRLAEGALLLLGVLVGLMIAVPSFKPAQLIQILGIGSVAIGFAFRDIFQNFLAGIILLLSEPFAIGDQIIVGSFEGTVEQIETRATFLRTYDGRRIVIPNSTLFTESVTVNTAFETRRLQYDIGIGYGDDIDTARQLILDCLHQAPSALNDPAPECVVIALDDSTVNLRARWWINPPRKADTFRSLDEVLTAVKNTLTANGIDLPYPTRQILFHDQSESTDGNRAKQREGWPAKEGASTEPRPIGSATPTPRPDSPRPNA